MNFKDLMTGKFDKMSLMGKYDEEGADALVPLMYRLDKTEGEGACTPIPAVGRLYVFNGPTWSVDGNTFYMTDSMS